MTPEPKNVTARRRAEAKREVLAGLNDLHDERLSQEGSFDDMVFELNLFANRRENEWVELEWDLLDELVYDYQDEYQQDDFFLDDLCY